MARQISRKSYWRSGLLAIALAGASLGLSGCFDVGQNVSIDRSGAGRYEIAVTGQGIVGDALKDEKLVNRQNHAVMATTDLGGNVTRRATVDFKSISELAFSDETMMLNVKSRDFFGLGASHVAFTTAVLIDKAKRENPRAAQANGVGEKIAQSILGNHTYSFIVTVPGDVERAMPITLGDQTYEPTVTGDFYNGHTVTWRVPLYALVNAQTLDFEVDFWAWGFFDNTKSQLVAND